MHFICGASNHFLIDVHQGAAGVYLDSHCPDGSFKKENTMRTHGRMRIASGALLLLAAVCGAVYAATDRIVKIDRPDQPPLLYLATVPDTGAPRTGAILFVGGDGVVNLADNGIPDPGDSFLVKARQAFAGHGVVTAIFEPGAASAPLSDRIRMSALHAQEVDRVLTDFKSRFQLDRVYLVGTSRGTISAAHLALRFRKKIDGVVLASTVFSSSRTGPGLAGFDYQKIEAPLLFVHHRHDACKVTPPAEAEKMQARFPVVFIDGGEEGAGEACKPFGPHGFLGREEETVAAISEWILSRKVRTN
jgi:predicted alpha/beta hydrolase family esterase